MTEEGVVWKRGNSQNRVPLGMWDVGMIGYRPSTRACAANDFERLVFESHGVKYREGHA